MQFKRFLLFLLLLLSSLPLLAEAPEDKLQGYLSELQSLEADFSQQLLDARGQALQKTQGRLRLLKPGRFHWETHQPFPEVLISDGQTLWLYDPDLEQVSVQPLDQRLAATPALVLSGEITDLSEDFDIRYQQDEATEVFTLQPLEQDSLFASLQLYFQQGQLVALQLKDSLGQKTRVDFTNRRYNQPLDPAAFDFVIPDDVDVIEG